MSLIFVSETSTRRSSLNLSDFDIYPSQFDMQINPAPDVDVKPIEETGAATEEERDPLYFCENVVLKAEDRIFSVPRSGLIEHGTYFHSLFNINQEVTNGIVSDAGSSEKHPIVLDGVSKIHFHNLLRLIYPFRGIDPPSGDEHWLGILDLATKWGFQEIREAALTHLEHIFTSSSHYRDPIRALYLCKKYDIRQHIKRQYETLITSITPLDYPAMFARGIDEETILHLMQLREKWFCGMVWGERGSKTGLGGLLPCRLSARTIAEDHFSGSSAAVVEEDKVEEDTWIGEETSRLNATVQHLEEMENMLIQADRERKLAEAKAEAEKRAKEEDERTRIEQEELARKKEEERPESQAGFVQPSNNDEPSPAADDKDDIQSVASDMSIRPPSEAGPRLESLILLHAEKHDLLKRVDELERVGVDNNNPRMKELKSVMQKYEQKLQKCWEYGNEMAFFTDVEEDVIDLESWNEDKSMSKMEERLGKLLSPSTRSLRFTITIGPKRNLAFQQRMAVRKTTEYYNLSKYRVDDPRNCTITKVNVPENEFGEWLAGYRRLKAEREGRSSGE